MTNSRSKLDPQTAPLIEACRQELFAVPSAFRVTIEFDDLPSDVCLIEAYYAEVLRFTLSDHFSSGERAHFYMAHQWLPAAKFFTQAANAYQFDLEALLWLDDLATKPGLAFSKTAGLQQVGIPDPFFIRSGGYSALRIGRGLTKEEWQNRHDIVFWRGTSTGYRSLVQPDWRDLPRFRLCQILQDYARNDFIDVGVSDIVQICDPKEIAEIKESGLLRDRVSQDLFARYRYAIDIDGNTNSWPGLFTKLLYGCTVLKIASQGGYSQWYYDRMKPWTHFVPVRPDMSDLYERLDWLHAFQDEAFAIARRGQDFARSLTFDGEMARMVSDLSCARIAA